MVVAYLRGLLKPNLPYGSRSYLSEQLVLEALSYESMADIMHLEVANDFTITNVIQPEARQEHLGRAYRRMDRLSQLRVFDVFRVEQQLAVDPTVLHRKRELSTYQIYKIAEEQGVFEMFAEDDDKARANAKPLL